MVGEGLGLLLDRGARRRHQQLLRHDAGIEGGQPLQDHRVGMGHVQHHRAGAPSLFGPSLLRNIDRRDGGQKEGELAAVRLGAGAVQRPLHVAHAKRRAVGELQVGAERQGDGLPVLRHLPGACQARLHPGAVRRRLQQRVVDVQGDPDVGVLRRAGGIEVLTLDRAAEHQRAAAGHGIGRAGRQDGSGKQKDGDPGSALHGGSVDFTACGPVTLQEACNSTRNACRPGFNSATLAVQQCGDAPCRDARTTSCC